MHTGLSDGTVRFTVDSRRRFRDEVVIQPCKNLRHIPDAHCSPGGRGEAKLALELDIVHLLETKPLLVCEEVAKFAVAKSDGFVGAQLLRFKSILSSPIEAHAHFVQASSGIGEVNADPFVGGVGSGARMVVVKILELTC